VAILRADQAAVRAYLEARGWRFEIARAGQLSPWPAGAILEPPLHVLWCRHATQPPGIFELLLNESAGTLFQFRRDTAITLPLVRAFVPSPAGLPVLAPEIVLLYKAKRAEGPNVATDFANSLPVLNEEQRAWLRAGLARLHPGHRWLAALET
jgi:hypothetical protein